MSGTKAGHVYQREATLALLVLCGVAALSMACLQLTPPAKLSLSPGQQFVAALDLSYQVIVPSYLPHDMRLFRIQRNLRPFVAGGERAQWPGSHLVTLTFANGAGGANEAWFWLYETPTEPQVPTLLGATTAIAGVPVRVLDDIPNRRMSVWWIGGGLAFELRTLTDGALTRTEILDIVESVINPTRRRILSPATVREVLGIAFDLFVPQRLPYRMELEEVNIFDAGRWPKPVPEFSPQAPGPVGFPAISQNSSPLVLLSFREPPTFTVQGNVSYRQEGEHWAYLYQAPGEVESTAEARPVHIGKITGWLAEQSQTHGFRLLTLAWTQGAKGFYLLSDPGIMAPDAAMEIAASGGRP